MILFQCCRNKAASIDLMKNIETAEIYYKTDKISWNIIDIHHMYHFKNVYIKIKDIIHDMMILFQCCWNKAALLIWWIIIETT